MVVGRSASGAVWVLVDWLDMVVTTEREVVDRLSAVLLLMGKT